MLEYEQITDCEIFELGDVRLRSGATLRGAKLAYKTLGQLNAAKDNVILFPTCFSGTHKSDEYLVGKGKALDPDKYFIIQLNQLGNGLSSSPSNTPVPYNEGRFPLVTILDNVECQHKLVTEKFGIERVALVCGYSMGAMQKEQPATGLRALARVYAGWGLSQAFYYRHLYLEHGFSSLEDFLIGFWENNYLKKTRTTCCRWRGPGSMAK